MTNWFIDIWEGNIITSLDAAITAGAEGIMHRAYYGVTRDAHVDDFWSRMQTARDRAKRWLYFFIRWSQSPREQACRHADYALRHPGDFHPVIDIEQDGLLMPGCRADDLYQYEDQWRSETGGATPYDIYTSPYYWGGIAVGPATGGLPPFLAARHDLVLAEWFTPPEDMLLQEYIAWRRASNVQTPWRLPLGFLPPQVVAWQSCGDKPRKIICPGIIGPVDVIETHGA